MYVPMQPDQFQSYPSQGVSSRHVAVPPQAVPPSFYGAGVVPTGPQQSVQQQQQQQQHQQQQRNPFSVPDGLQPMGAVKHLRGSGGGGGGSMDPWPR